MDVVADKGVYIGDISEGHHCDLGQIVAVAQEGEVVGEVLLLQATLVDHGLQVPEQSDQYWVVVTWVVEMELVV